MKLKKITALCLTLTMIISSGVYTVFAEEETTEITGEVEFANDKLTSLDASITSGLAERLTEVSGINVEIMNYPDVASYQTYIQQSIRTEDAPGLITWWGDQQFVTLAENGLLEDLTDLWNDYLLPAGVPESAAEALTVDGKIYGVLYGILYSSIHYNMDVFEEVGVEVPTTFDEFLDVCEKIKAAGITPIALKSDSWAGFIWFQHLLAAKDPQLYLDVCDGTKKYTDPEVVEVMNIWQDMFDKGYFGNPISYQDINRQLASGETAMELEDYSNITNLVNDYGMVSGENLGQFLFPSMDGEKDVTFYSVSPICVPAASKDKGSAMEVLKHYYENDVQNFLFESLGYVNTSNVEITDVTIQSVFDDVEDSENCIQLVRYYENTPEEIRNFALDELMKFELGDGSVDEVLNNIQEKADEVWAAQE